MQDRPLVGAKAIVKLLSAVSESGHVDIDYAGRTYTVTYADMCQRADPMTQ
jgi:hypothetical protein